MLRPQLQNELFFDAEYDPPLFNWIDESVAGTNDVIDDVTVDKRTVQPDDNATKYSGLGTIAAIAVTNDVIVELPEPIYTGDSTTPIIYGSAFTGSSAASVPFTPINLSDSSSVVSEQIKPFFLSQSSLIMAGIVAFVFIKQWGK